MARRTGKPITREAKAEMRRRRRELRKQSGMTTARVVDVGVERTPQEDAQFWSGVRVRLKASAILNSLRDRPYWASIRKDTGNPPVSGFFPCLMVAKGDRWYYGFLFREHRDQAFKQWRKKAKHLRARKELTGGRDSPLT